MRLWRSGSVALSSGETVAGLERVDRQKMVVFGGRGVSRLELSVASTVQCVPSLELSSTLPSPGGVQPGRRAADLENPILSPFQNSHISY